MKAILKSEDLLPYLNNPDTENSSYPKPDPEDPKVTHKSIQKNDDAIVTAIFLATAEEFCKFIDLDNKAYQAWKNLEDYFLSQSSNNVNRLEEELQAIVIDNCMSMADYTNKKLEKCLELAAAKEDRANTDQYKVKAIMAGLRGHPQYGHCAVMFEDVHHSLHKFLGQLNNTYASMPNTQKEGALYARPNVICYKCNKPGHIQRDCGQPSTTNTSHRIPNTCYWCKKPGHKIQECRAFKNTGQVLRHRQEEPTSQSGNIAYEHALTATNSKSTLHTPTTIKTVPNSTNAHPGSEYWTVDSGASSYMTNCLADFQEYKQLKEPISVHTADAQVQLQATAIGTVRLGPDMPYLTKTLFVPGLAHKLFSLSKILDKGYSTHFSASHFHVVDSHGSQILSGVRHGDLYYIQQTTETVNHANLAISENTQHTDSSTGPTAKPPKHIPTQVISRTMKEWHEVLGHISKEAIIRTSKAVKGMVISDKHLPFCDACALSKAKKLPFPTEDPDTTCKEIGDIIVGDYQGPFAQRSLGGANGISSYIDRASGYVFSTAVKHKTSVFDHFVSINERYKTIHGRSIRILRTDNGGEYKNTLFTQYCQQNGIIHQFTNPHTPEQNKCAEKHNQILYEKLLSILNATNLSRALWAEVHQTTVHIHNRTVRTGYTKTPYELWTGECPNLSNLHPIGTPTFVLIPKSNQQKLITNKALKGTLVGFGEDLGTKGYRILDSNNKIICSRHVVFNSRNNNSPATTISDTTSHEYHFDLRDDQYTTGCNNDLLTDTAHTNDQPDTPVTSLIPLSPDPPMTSSERPSPPEDLTHISNNCTEDPIEHMPESPLHNNRFLKELESHLGKAFEPINDTRRPTATMAHAYMAAPANPFIDTPEPTSYAEAMSGPEAQQWQQSVEREFQSWIDNGVAAVIDLKEVPPHAKIIQGRPVFKRKINELGEVV
jgi:hypothetical protein